MDTDKPRLRPFFVPGLLDEGQRLEHGLLDGRQVVDPRHWSDAPLRDRGAERDGSRTWATVSPLVPDRYVHRSDNPIDHVIAACRFAGYPEPERVEILAGPSLRGSARLRTADLRRRAADPARAGLHCRIAFATRVRGPVLLGNLRHLGVGLCLPVADDTETAPAPLEAVAP